MRVCDDATEHSIKESLCILTFGWIASPTNEVMFLLRSVCLSVRRITEKVVNRLRRTFLEE